MSKKFGLGILLGLFLLLISSPSDVYADGDKVSDMWDENTDVSEEQKSDSPDTNSDEDGQVSIPNQEDTPQVEPESDNGGLAFDLIRMVFALLLILALIYLLLKFLNKRNKLFNQVKTLENLGGIAVGPSKSIQIVRVGSKLYMIGVGENVQLLEEITDEAMKEEILKSNEEQTNFTAGNILNIFRQNREQSSTKSKKSGHDFKQLFSNELEKLKQNRKNLMNRHTEKEDNHE
ncbi:flagellar biosynthetic protein FliO [Ornithinibacillus xuwenensis]|uniref:Flagellar biosynthetic protein FliO n=1 Tax=Ornithinibacillus xuwenensis TaxID=3144668 RepID=A0ABU9XHV5_9BACI